MPERCTITAVVTEQQSSLGVWQCRFDLVAMRLEARVGEPGDAGAREAVLPLTPQEAETVRVLASRVTGTSRTLEPFLFQPVTQTVTIQRGRRRVRLSCDGGTLSEVDASAAALHAHGEQCLRAALRPDAASRGDG